tara:strand:+ start:4110 stop:5405 length:1296 start_codon:yes stop_codon:yes gene_type:complete
MALRPRDRDQIQALHGKVNAKYMPKAKTRMAGEEMPAGLEPLLREIREEGAEELRQEAIVQAMHPEVNVQGLINGSSKTAEQQVARGLLYEGVMPDVLPADRYAVEDLADRTQLGIAGPFQQDSTVRQSTTGGLNSAGELEIQHHPVMTEYLSPQGEDRLYAAWSQLVPPYMRKTNQFNAAAGEYYGQQMLKAVGYSPVSDTDRSVRSQRASDRATTEGTDRLIENSRGLLDEEIDRSGDYRYNDPQGNVRVGDYQTGEVRDTIRLNLLKALTPDVAQNFKQNYNRGVKQVLGTNDRPTPLNVIDELIQDGTLPPVKQGSEGRGIRAGKALSGQPYFEEQNPLRQYRYDDVLYGHSTPARRESRGGYIPEDVILVDAAKANDAMGLVIPSVMTHGGMREKGADAAPKINDLIRLGAAQRLTDDPRIKQLLQ